MSLVPSEGKDPDRFFLRPPDLGRASWRAFVTSSSVQRGSSPTPGLVSAAPEFFGAIDDLLLGEGDEIDEPEFLGALDGLLLEEIDEIDGFQRLPSDSSGLVGSGRLGADLAGLEVDGDVAVADDGALRLPDTSSCWSRSFVNMRSARTRSESGRSVSSSSKRGFASTSSSAGTRDRAPDPMWVVEGSLEVGCLISGVPPLPLSSQSSLHMPHS